mmetsp:Transcript_58688/g.134612  ORF Transcript_58688/g.134612 Transcript_58688/m.134612 type:complete len:182 (+) Transcript_58688:394-939(+)
MLPNATVHQGEVDVLIATSDSSGHGLFAIIERIINQLIHAKQHALSPFVFVGPVVFREPSFCAAGLQPYYSPLAGDNVWEYYFEQPGKWRPDKAVLPDGRRVRSLQVVSPQSLYHTSGSAQTYTGSTAYEAERMLKHRTAAHSAVGNGSLVFCFENHASDFYFIVPYCMTERLNYKINNII